MYLKACVIQITPSCSNIIASYAVMSTPTALIIRRLRMTRYAQGLYPQCALIVIYHDDAYSDTVAAATVLAWDLMLTSNGAVSHVFFS
jgi:hypothetical protein